MWRLGILSVAVIVVMNTGTERPARATLSPSAASAVRAPTDISGSLVSSDAPSLDRRLHRLFNRAERSAGRLGSLIGLTGLVWLGIVVSVSAFLLVTAISSVVDIRMLNLSPRTLPRYLANGARTFFRLVKDRRTPNLARSVLAAALVYWLVPIDLIPDESVIPGFVDDLVIAVSAAKGFIYLCPDALIATHAAAVEAEGHDHAQAH